MPITSLQRDVLRAIAGMRSRNSYVAGSTPHAVDTPRYSEDIDVFNDDEETLNDAVLRDLAALRAMGLVVELVLEQPSFRRAELRSGDRRLKLEWAVDSAFRFFEVLPDRLFGYRLHPFDNATNKVMAAAGRRQARDMIDLVYYDRDYLPLGPLIAAAVEKHLGYDPEQVIADIRRHSSMPAAEWEKVSVEGELEPRALHADLMAALDRAEPYLETIPADMIGKAFIDRAGRIVPWAPGADLIVHEGRTGGHWPDNADIRHAMMLAHGVGPRGVNPGGADPSGVGSGDAPEAR